MIVDNIVATSQTLFTMAPTYYQTETKLEPNRKRTGNTLEHNWNNTETRLEPQLTPYSDYIANHSGTEARIKLEQSWNKTALIELPLKTNRNYLLWIRDAVCYSNNRKSRNIQYCTRYRRKSGSSLNRLSGCFFTFAPSSIFSQ